MIFNARIFLSAVGGFVFCSDRFFSTFWENEEGQGITEYGAILAFICILISLTFGLTNGSLMPAVSKAFSAVTSQLNGMASTAANASGS